MSKEWVSRVVKLLQFFVACCGVSSDVRWGQARREGGAEGVIARGPGDTEGPWVQNCQDRMQDYGLRTPLVYLGGAIVLCTPPFDPAF